MALESYYNSYNIGGEGVAVVITFTGTTEPYEK